MTPVPSQEPLQQQIYRELAAELTARLEGQELSWTAVNTAERRRQARVRLTIARCLEASDTYPGVAEALMVLAEVADHFKRLCLTVGSLPNVIRHYWTKLWASDLNYYKLTILGSGPEILSIRNNVQNNQRRYIAGLDPLEQWDQQMVQALQILPQYLS